MQRVSLRPEGIGMSRGIRVPSVPAFPSSPGYGGFPDSFFPYRLLVRWISHYGRALHKQPSDAAFPPI